VGKKSIQHPASSIQGLYSWIGAKLGGVSLGKRILSSLVLAPLAVLVAYVGGAIYDVTVAAVMLLGMAEWVRMFAPNTKGRIWWALLGLLYMSGSGAALIALRYLYGFQIVLFLFVCVWATDIGAFLAGRLIGGPKLWPAISPKKTWAGVFGGMAFAALFGYGVARGLGETQLRLAVRLGLALSVAAQLGDLFESYVKRRSGVKDSGQLIPGHGGVLDRIDGLLLASLVFAVFQVVTDDVLR
jgi:phosphatidate cytidylyltransferase